MEWGNYTGGLQLKYLRKLDSLDCHIVVFATLTIFAVIFSIPQQNNLMALRSVVENFGGDIIRFLDGFLIEFPPVVILQSFKEM